VPIAVENRRGLWLALTGLGLALALLVALGLAPDALAQEEHGAEGGGAAEEHGAAAEEEEGGSFLVSPGLGLMLWTLLLFGVTMYFLSKTALPKIGEALEKRANAIRENIEESEKTRQEADKLLEEYRARLKEAREQADDIAARARKATEAANAEASAEGKAKREELVAAARKDIETETRRSLEQIRKEVADLTVLATETLTRKSLSGQDHQKLVEEALAEVDFGALAGEENGGVSA
jgi:F-type H+-transporting ATPase subunit b